MKPMNFCANHIHVVFVLSTMLLINFNTLLAEEDQLSPEMKKSLAKAVQALKGIELKPEESGIILYTLKKVDTNPDDKLLNKALGIVLSKFQSDKYKPTKDHIYEAAMDSLALEVLDNVKYRPQIEAVVKYIYDTQGNHGSWFYTDSRNVPAQRGDTSMAQYALLSFWSAARAGIKIKPEVLNKTAKWLLTTQDDDGGYYYHPHNRSHVKSITMTAAGVCCTGIIRLLYYGDRAPVNNSKTYGVLSNAEPASSASALIEGRCDYTALSLDKSSDKGLEWLNRNYTFTPNEKTIEKRFVYYYCYTLERMSAIQNLQLIGNHDWYEDGFNYIRKTQSPQGLWVDGIGGYSGADTCFNILFIKRVTNKILNRSGSGLGGGLLIGGRGLPDDLNDVSRTNSGTITAKKSLGTMDDLLAELEKSEVVDLEATQQAIVETVQLGKPEELIGQRDKLLKLVDHQDPDIRRTALWALSRCSVLEDAGIFVKKLNDGQLDVAVEARNGLCWLSRQINGLGEPAHPADLLNKDEEWESASEERKLEVIKKWRLDANGVWEKWFFKNRPYELRDDLVEPLPKAK